MIQDAYQNRDNAPGPGCPLLRRPGGHQDRGPWPRLLGPRPAGSAKRDCQYLAQIGFASQGLNPVGNNGHIWIGNDGPNTFTFSSPNSDVILVLWDQTAGYSSSFVTGAQTVLTYSLPKGSSVTVSLANGISGAWTGLYDHSTGISPFGQVHNTWAEFTTGAYATVDISREVNMQGNQLVAKVSTGCVANNSQCAFICKSGNSCGDSGTYDLINCASQPYGNVGALAGNPEGGCSGWSNGGHIDAYFL